MILTTVLWWLGQRSLELLSHSPSTHYSHYYGMLWFPAVVSCDIGIVWCDFIRFDPLVCGPATIHDESQRQAPELGSHVTVTSFIFGSYLLFRPCILPPRPLLTSMDVYILSDLEYTLLFQSCGDLVSWMLKNCWNVLFVRVAIKAKLRLSRMTVYGYGCTNYGGR